MLNRELPPLILWEGAAHQIDEGLIALHAVVVARFARDGHVGLGDGVVAADGVVDFAAILRVGVDAVFARAEATCVEGADLAVCEGENGGGAVLDVVVFDVGDDAPAACGLHEHDVAEEVAADVEVMDGLLDGLAT